MADYHTEYFGILTDDDLYLDCMLFMPENFQDNHLKTIRVWVARYPLSKTSILACARHEIRCAPVTLATAHLIFDLRGTGESEGSAANTNFKVDLLAIKAWAQERFGRIRLSFLGQPTGYGLPNLFPIGPGVTLEYYAYNRSQSLTDDVVIKDDRTVIYLSSPGNFSKSDDDCCQDLTNLGYDVLGIDPLRYLLHTAGVRRVLPLDLWLEFGRFIKDLSVNPMIIGQPLSAGLALLLAAGIEEITGAVAIGRAQNMFASDHIFLNDDVRTYSLGRHAGNISPRPVVIGFLEGHPLGGDSEDLRLLFNATGVPHRYISMSSVDSKTLVGLLDWIAAPEDQPSD